MNLPKDYPIAERKVGFEWSDSARWQRIGEVLSGTKKLTLADAMDLQNDDTSMLARRLTALLKPLTSDDANTKQGLGLAQSLGCARYRRQRGGRGVRGLDRATISGRRW